MVSSIFVLAAAFAGLATAMNSTSYTSQYTVAASTVDSDDKATWCQNQQTTCIDLCSGGQTTQNSCSQDDLSWACTCAMGITPNISSYQQTVPFFECTRWKAVCVNSTDSAAQQQQCNAVVCATNVYTAGSTTSSSSSSTTSTSSSVAAASSVTTTATTTVSVTNTVTAAATSATTGAAVALNWGQSYSLGALGVGAFALFGLAL